MSDLTNIISNWLKEEMPEWIVIRRNAKTGFWFPKHARGAIAYRNAGYEYAYIYDDKVELIHEYIKDKKHKSYNNGLGHVAFNAHVENFFPLLSNRLYMAGIAYEKARTIREFIRNRPNT